MAELRRHTGLSNGSARMRADVGDAGEVTALIGYAESADGCVRASYQIGAGLSALEIDEHAMRLPKQELEELICAVTQEAWADLQRQLRKTIADLGDAADLPTEVAKDPMMVVELLREISAMSEEEREATLD